MAWVLYASREGGEAGCESWLELERGLKWPRNLFISFVLFCSRPVMTVRFSL